LVSTARISYEHKEEEEEDAAIHTSIVIWHWLKDSDALQLGI